MAAIYADPLPAPRIDRTADDAIERADALAYPVRPLMVSIEERCGEDLIAAFLAAAGAWFTGRDAAARETVGISG